MNEIVPQRYSPGLVPLASETQIIVTAPTPTMEQRLAGVVMDHAAKQSRNYTHSRDFLLGAVRVGGLGLAMEVILRERLPPKHYVSSRSGKTYHSPKRGKKDRYR